MQLLLLTLKLAPFMLGASRKYDYIFTFECGKASFIVSLLQTITLSRKPKHIILQFIMREKGRGMKSRLKYLFMRFCFSSTYKAVCSSREEAKYYADAFGWAPDRACFAPLHTDPALLDVCRPVEDRLILSAGRTFRDYKTLLSAVEGLDARAVIVASPRSIAGLNVPETVECFFDIKPAELTDIMARSEIVVVPLEGRRISTGQSVLLQAMAMGKAVIATRTSGTIDYIIHMENGMFVEPADPTGLKEAIDMLLRDAGLRKRLGENARESVRKMFLPEHYYNNVRAIVKNAKGM